MANYFTNDTDLTAVADAIRAKGGTSSPLEYPDEFVSAIEDISTVNNQNKTRSYTPTETAQGETVTADSGFTGLGQVSVSVGAIDSNYVGSGIPRRASSSLTASGATVTAPSGYYANSASKTISSGSATPAASISATGATVSTGTNTLTFSKSVSNTPQVTAGYVASGTSGNTNVSLTASVTTQGAQTIHPSSSDQTIASGRYLTGTQTFKAVTTNNITAANIAAGVTVEVGDADDSDRILSVTGTHSGGGGAGSTWQDANGYVHLSDEPGSYITTMPLSVTDNGTYTAPTGVAYTPVNVSVSATPTLQNKTVSPSTSQQSVQADSGYDGLGTVTVNAMPSGTAGTPTATKGTVSNHAVTVTPSVTNTTGYITGSTKTGTGVQVTASELASGNKAITENGTNIDVVGYSTVSVEVSGGATYTATITPHSGNVNVCVQYDDTAYYTLDDTFTYHAGDTLTAICRSAMYTDVYVDDVLVASDYKSDRTASVTYDYTLPVGNITIDLAASNTMTREVKIYTYPPLITKNITENGTYNASDDNADGYSSVTVSVFPPSGAVQKQINFIDYDGTIVASYTGAEWANVSTLPSNPSHTGLVAQGWNWTKAQIDAQLVSIPNGPVWVGQLYTTSSNETEIDFSIEHDNSEIALRFAASSSTTLTFTWGDGDYTTNVRGVGITTPTSQHHTYALAGNYTITIKEMSSVEGDKFRFIGASSAGSNIIMGIINGMNYSTSITAIRLGRGITVLGSYAFKECTNLKYITMKSTMATISSGTFSKCYSLKCIIVPPTITTITGITSGNECGAERVSYPPGATLIDSSAFSKYRKLNSVTIPYTVTSMGSSCFSYSGIEELYLPSGGVTITSSSAFRTCNFLKKIEGTITFGSSSASTAFQEATALRRVTFGQFEVLPTNTFYSSTSLVAVDLPSNLTTINSNAFYDCISLQKITIPSTVTSIGSSAFSGCTCLTECHVLSLTPPTLGSSAFDQAYNIAIYVPYSADHSVLEAYQTAWTDYSSKIYEESP